MKGIIVDDDEVMHDVDVMPLADGSFTFRIMPPAGKPVSFNTMFDLDSKYVPTNLVGATGPKVRKQRAPTKNQWRVLDYLKTKPNSVVYMSEARVDLHRKYPERPSEKWANTMNVMVQRGMLEGNSHRGTKRVVSIPRAADA